VTSLNSFQTPDGPVPWKFTEIDWFIIMDLGCCALEHHGLQPKESIQGYRWCAGPQLLSQPI